MKCDHKHNITMSMSMIQILLAYHKANIVGTFYRTDDGYFFSGCGK